MPLLKEEITEAFIENMVDRVIDRLGAKFEDLDISLDYIAAILSGHSVAALGAQQATTRRAGLQRTMPAPARHYGRTDSDVE